VALLELLKAGENDHVEFKSSLRWDYKQNQMNKALENVILKTITAFLNTNGGTLIIGVDDSGSILGLKNDYETVSKKSRDGFILTLTNLINQHLGKRVHKFINLEIVNHDDKDICAVTVSKCDGPVFLGKNDNETFYIRASASSQRLSVSEVVGYIKSHWKS
jgi:predicted HTH transcriptional regulator